MHSIIALSALPALVAAATHQVKVGDGGLKFEPATVTAAKGDTVQFMWASDDHSVVQGDPNKACSPTGASAFNSGVVTEGMPTWTLTINSTDPIYYYCSVNRHCQLGMVGGINVPSIDDYKTAASKATDNVKANSVQGGTFGTSSGGSSSSMGSSSMMSSGSSSSMSMTMGSSSSMMSSMSMTMSSGSSMATGAGASSMSSTSSSHAAAPTHFVAAIVAGLPAAVVALL